jgi:hypothetical protein
MDPYQPFMLLRARPRDDVREKFSWWFRNVHLKDVANIPGIAAVQSGSTRGGLMLGFYGFASTEQVQAALASPQAAYARGTWEQWAPQLEELFIEIWAPVVPFPIYRSVN